MMINTSSMHQETVSYVPAQRASTGRLNPPLTGTSCVHNLWRFSMRAPGFFLFVLSLTACTNQQIYDASRHNAQTKCQEPPQVQYEKCMAEVTETYESYSRKREEVVGGK